MKMKISLVIHGPETIDSGEVKIILEKLSLLGEVKAELSGTMGKTAVLDAGLEKVIDITRHVKPSVCIESSFETSDLVCLLNRGKTFETGRIFGSKVASRLKESEKKPLVQIEIQGFPSGRLIPLNKKAINGIEKLSEVLGLPAETPLPFYNPMSMETCSITGKPLVARKISGVLPGENIFLNGIVIGKALSSEIKIVSENGFITAIEGGEIKEHGLEKIHNYEKRDPIDLAGAWIKSGDIRRNNFSFADIQKQPMNSRKPDFTPRTMSGKAVQGKVVIIDHAAENTFELAVGAELAITVGDDTTAIAGDILFRLGIPIIGLIDGDCDDVTCEPKTLPGSVILRLVPGSDDILGERVKQELLGGEKSAVFENLSAFRDNLLRLAEPLTEAIVEY